MQEIRTCEKHKTHMHFFTNALHTHKNAHVTHMVALCVFC